MRSGRGFQGRGGPGNRNTGTTNTSKFKKTLLKASEDIVFSESSPWEGGRFTLEQLIKQILRQVNQDPTTVQYSEYIMGYYDWNEENQAFEIPLEFSHIRVPSVPRTSDEHFVAKMSIRREAIKDNLEMTKA